MVAYITFRLEDGSIKTETAWGNPSITSEELEHDKADILKFYGSPVIEVELSATTEEFDAKLKSVFRQLARETDRMYSDPTSCYERGDE